MIRADFKSDPFGPIWTLLDHFRQNDFFVPNGQKPFETFPKIHPFWTRNPSLKPKKFNFDGTLREGPTT